VSIAAAPIHSVPAHAVPIHAVPPTLCRSTLCRHGIRGRPEEPVEVRSWEALAPVTTLAGAAGSLLAIYALISI
jgi:hypothetical protein